MGCKFFSSCFRKAFGFVDGFWLLHYFELRDESYLEEISGFLTKFCYLYHVFRIFVPNSPL